MLTRPSHRCYYRIDRLKGKSWAKFEVFDGFNWTNRDQMMFAFETGYHGSLAGMLRPAYDVFIANGMDPEQRDRLLERKTISLSTANFPFAELAAIGWDFYRYPMKYNVHDDITRKAVCDNAKKNGVVIDVSSVVGDGTSIMTNGLSLLGLLNLLKKHGIEYHLYVDYASFGWMKAKELDGASWYLNGLLRATDSDVDIFESEAGKSADPDLLKKATEIHGHVISLDTYSDFDMVYPWVMNSAEEGDPRLHRFAMNGDQIGIPDLGLWGDIPTEWPSFPYAA